MSLSQKVLKELVEEPRLEVWRERNLKNWMRRVTDGAQKESKTEGNTSNGKEGAQNLIRRFQEIVRSHTKSTGRKRPESYFWGDDVNIKERETALAANHTSPGTCT